jgi:hypothetical protein
MAVVGFNFSKIAAEKHNIAAKGIKVRNDLNMKDVQELGIAFGKEKQPTLKLKFEFKSIYEPKVGEILIEGEVLYLQEAKKLTEIMDSWKKSKRLPNDVIPAIMNQIITKCSIQAINLASDMGIPSPIPLPKVTAKK